MPDVVAWPDRSGTNVSIMKSRAVGERKLFPAIRDRESDSTVVAPGFSCRQQIEHFTGVDAVSAVQVIEPLVKAKDPA